MFLKVLSIKRALDSLKIQEIQEKIRKISPRFTNIIRKKKLLTKTASHFFTLS